MVAEAIGGERGSGMRQRLRDIGWLALAGILLSLYMGAMTLLVLTCWGATGWSIVWHLAGFAVLAAIPLWLAREWRG